jgi:hypothetical protein
MTWLAHHEFGLEHRPFWLESERPFQASAYPTSSINYWLETWLRTYGWLHHNRPRGSILVCYEDLCSDPAGWWRILERLDVPHASHRELQPFRQAEDREVSGLDASLVAQARALYGELRLASTRDLAIEMDAMPRSAVR